MFMFCYFYDDDDNDDDDDLPNVLTLKTLCIRAWKWEWSVWVING